MKDTCVQKHIANTNRICLVARDLLIHQPLHRFIAHKAFGIGPRRETIASILNVENGSHMPRQFVETTMIESHFDLSLCFICHVCFLICSMPFRLREACAPAVSHVLIKLITF